MKKKLSICFAVAAALFISTRGIALSQTNQTVTGNLTVNGTSDLCGNALTIGRQANPADYGIGILYDDTGSGLASVYLNRTTSTLAWTRKPASGSTAVTLMTLDASGNLTTTGTINTLPSQTLTGSSSILTMGLGDGRYLQKGTTTLNWGAGSSTNGSGSISLGDGASTISTATAPAIALGLNSKARSSQYGGPYSGIAIGTNANAGNSTDIGGGIAIGANTYCSFQGMALGNGSQSVGDGATAIGKNTIASGELAYGQGYNTRAYGKMSAALGNNTIARGYLQFVVGSGNIDDTGANATAIVQTDNAFVVGNGPLDELGQGTRANAFTIKWNGDAAMSGNAAIAKNLTVTQNSTLSGNLTVSGTGTFAGQVSVSSSTGKLRVPAKGGISMGEFTVGGAP